MEVERSLSVERPAGARHGAGRGERDARRAAADREQLRRGRRSRSSRCPGIDARRASRLERRADAVLQHEGRRNVDQAEIEREEAAEIYGEEAEEEVEAEKARAAGAAQAEGLGADRARAHGLLPDVGGRDAAQAQPRLGDRRGRRLGPERAARRARPCRTTPARRRATPPSRSGSSTCRRTRSAARASCKFPSDRRLRKLTPRASKPDPPEQRAEAARRTRPLKTPDDGGKFKHVFYIVRENRTYDQILGADPRGDGDPKLELFGEEITPNAHALAERFPLLDHVYANSEASIDGHFWTSAAAVSDYVSKNWHQNYGGPHAAVRLRHLLGHVAGRRLPVRPGPEAGHLVVQLRRGDRRRRAAGGRRPHARRRPSEVIAKFRKSDLGTTPGLPPPVPRDRRHRRRLLPQRRVLRRSRRGALGGPGPDIEVYDSALPAAGRRPDAGRAGRDRPVALRLLQAEVRAAARAGRRAAVHLHHLRERPHGRHHARAGARRTR